MGKGPRAVLDDLQTYTLPHRSTVEPRAPSFGPSTRSRPVAWRGRGDGGGRRATAYRRARWAMPSAACYGRSDRRRRHPGRRCRTSSTSRTGATGEARRATGKWAGETRQTVGRRRRRRRTQDAEANGRPCSGQEERGNVNEARRRSTEPVNNLNRRTPRSAMLRRMDDVPRRTVTSYRPMPGGR